MRRQARLAQDLRDIVREIRMPDLRCRYVDRDFRAASPASSQSFA
jgi:hypothetical protein